MKRTFPVLALAALLSTGSAMAANADQAVKEGVAASGHASGSAAHAIAASGQVTSAAIAVPMVVSGGVAVSAGVGSARAGADSARAATGAPLPIGDESATVMPPPDEALKKKPGDKGNI